MSNAIDLIVTKQAQQGVDELITKLHQAQEAMVQTSQAAFTLNKNIGSVTTPASLNARVAENTKYIASLEREIATSKRVQKQIETQRLAEIKLAQQREKAVDTYTKAEQRAAAVLAKSENIYSKVQAKVNALTATYNNLAAKKELGLRLSVREQSQLDSLTGRLTKYQTVLTNVDVAIGKHQRKVGNYASGYNGLSNSIAQISRELPNFGQSVQIGIMSLTNNIGALQDAIQGIKAQNAILQAEGKATRSVMSQIGASVLSWNTALYIGIALFSAYGKEIGEWVSNLFKGTEALDVIKESTESLNEVRLKSLKGITQERIDLELNIKTARNKALSDKERQIAAQKVLDQYPFWFENLGKEAIMNGNVQKAIEGVNAALLARAKSAAATEKITENYSKIIDLQEELRLEKILEAQRIESVKRVAKQATDVIPTTTRETSDLYQTSRVQDATEKLNSSKQKIVNTQKTINDLTAVNARLLGYTVAEYEKSIGLDYASTKAMEEKVKYYKYIADLDRAAYDLEKFRREQEILAISKIASDEQKSYEQRITAYGEMLKKKEELLLFSLDFEGKEVENARQKEIADANKDYYENLKKFKGNTGVTAQIQSDHRQQLENINNSYDSRQLLLRAKYNADYLAIVEESSKAELEIIRHRNEVLASTEKTYRDEQQAIFKKTADNEKLSVQIRQESFRAYIALRQKQIDIDKAAAIARAIANDEDVAAVKAQFSVLQNTLNQESETESPFAKSLEKANVELEKLKKSLTSGVFSDAGLGSLTKFFDGTFKSVIDGFDLIENKNERFLKKFQYTFTTIAELSKEVFSILTQNSDRYYQSAFERLETQKEISMRFAGESVAQRLEVEEFYEKRRAELQKRQAENEKKNAMFKAVINTASAIIAALPNIALSIAVGLVGAAQIAMIANQSIPAFETGLEAGPHKGGLLKMNDGKGSNYQETGVTPDGRIFKPKGRNVILNAPAGTDIYTHDQWQDHLNSFLAGQGIMTSSSAAAANQLSQHSSIDYNKMQNAFANAVSGIPRGDKFEVIRDANGYSAYKASKNSRVKILNSIVQIKGSNV